MKTNSSKGKKSRNKVNTFFSNSDKKRINKIARFTGFLKRKTEKIKPVFFITGFLKMTSKNLKTYDDLASEITLLCGKTVTRQAVEERINSEATNMVQLFFNDKLRSILAEKSKSRDRLKEKFSAIKIDDSTTLNLPKELYKAFPGNVSRGEKKSQLKIHTLYNFSDNSFSFLNIHAFTDNDQSLSENVRPYLQKGDLILRDLGFQTLSVQMQFIESGIFFISKKKFNVKVYNGQTGEEISLLKILRKKRFYDGDVLVGKEKNVRMRLVIKSLPKEIVAEKKRKAKNDRDRRLNHSLEYYEMLGYSILLTNIPQQMCSSEEIGELYGLRWRIETIFKSWKSYFSIDKLIPEKTNNPERIKCIIYLFLLFIVMFQTSFLRMVSGNNPHNVNHSIMKLAKIFKQHFGLLMDEGLNSRVLKLLSKHANYDIRKDRENTMEKFVKLVA